MLVSVRKADEKYGGNNRGKLQLSHGRKNITPASIGSGRNPRSLIRLDFTLKKIKLI